MAQIHADVWLVRSGQGGPRAVDDERGCPSKRGLHSGLLQARSNSSGGLVSVHADGHQSALKGHQNRGRQPRHFDQAVACSCRQPSVPSREFIEIRLRRLRIHYEWMATAPRITAAFS